MNDTDNKVKELSEVIFWDEDDPRLAVINKTEKRPRTVDDAQIVDMENDAYIWVFCGPRGAGKSLAMTHYAAKAVYLYNARIISNYPISFNLRRMNGKVTYHEAESLDLYKLLCFDEDYHHCIILMDEAPDIISHMASQTWKNRLINIFTRQLRKNMNSLLLGAQQISLIDKSMRWQTDIVVNCMDAFRRYGSSGGLVRGASILLDLYDNSGMWTGNGKFINHDGEFQYLDPDESLELPGRTIWGAYDTYYQQDVFESLKRVDMNLGSYEVGEKKDTSCLSRAVLAIEDVLNDGKRIKIKDLYENIGGLSHGEKTMIGTLMGKAKAFKDGRAEGYYNLDTFDMSIFLQGAG